MNKSSFLDYYKTILEKVSFDQKLLEKEYKKAKQLLKVSEVRELDYWMHHKGLAHKLNLSLDQNKNRIGDFH